MSGESLRLIVDLDALLSGDETIYGIVYIQKLLRKRCRILPAGGLGIPHSFHKFPNLGGLRG
jgi:hypothetical protein